MQDNKEAIIRLRVTNELKARFQAICKSKAINSSELLRQLISQWCYEQESNVINHKRTLDV